VAARSFNELEARSPPIDEGKLCQARRLLREPPRFATHFVGALRHIDGALGASDLYQYLPLALQKLLFHESRLRVYRHALRRAHATVVEGHGEKGADAPLHRPGFRGIRRMPVGIIAGEIEGWG